MCKKSISIRPTKYSYERITSSVYWEKFMEEIKDGNTIRKSDWYKKLGFNNATSFGAFLKNHEIEYKVDKFANNLSKEKLEELASDYHNSNFSIKEIQSKYGMCEHTIYKLIGKEKGSRKPRKRYNTLTDRINKNKNYADTAFGKACDLLTENNKPFEIDINGNIPLIILNCAKCGTEIERPGVKILAHFSKYKTFDTVCRNCYNNSEASSFASKKSLTKRNNTGYVGIQFYVSSSSGENIGYASDVAFKNKRLVRKYFPDNTLSKKTLMEAVVYREIYLIKNKLPHTRNLSNEELLSNLQMLGQHSEYEEIKNILDEQIMLNMFI